MSTLEEYLEEFKDKLKKKILVQEDLFMTVMVTFIGVALTGIIVSLFYNPFNTGFVSGSIDKIYMFVVASIWVVLVFVLTYNALLSLTGKYKTVVNEDQNTVGNIISAMAGQTYLMGWKEYLFLLLFALVYDYVVMGGIVIRGIDTMFDYYGVLDFLRYAVQFLLMLGIISGSRYYDKTKTVMMFSLVAFLNAVEWWAYYYKAGYFNDYFPSVTILVLVIGLLLFREHITYRTVDQADPLNKENAKITTVEGKPKIVGKIVKLEGKNDAEWCTSEGGEIDGDYCLLPD